MATKRKTTKKQQEEVTTPRLNPTYVFRFIVLASALKTLRTTGYNPVPGQLDIVGTARMVTGLHAMVDVGSVEEDSTSVQVRDIEKLEEAVRWLYAEIQKGVIVCPSCKKATVIPLVPAFAAVQTDGSTHVCHPYLDGCDMAFALTSETTS